MCMYVWEIWVMWSEVCVRVYLIIESEYAWELGGEYASDIISFLKIGRRREITNNVKLMLIQTTGVMVI